MSLRIIEPRAEPADPAEIAGARTLLCAAAVRNSAERMLGLALDGSLEDWTVDLDRLPTTADFVARVVRDRYPDLRPPLHARWRHFVFGGRDLWREIALAGRWPSQAAAARAAIDLVMTSVLLDAGANSDWRYRDSATGLTAGRSEGLALASLRLFERGLLSADPADPLRVDAAALQRLDTRVINEAFQVTSGNPLSGAAGRATLLNRLGTLLQDRPDLFALSDSPRPGGLYDVFARRASQGPLSAGAILETLLDALGPIWPDRPVLGGVSLGDCWPHPALRSEIPAQRYVPLHKLTQWLTYSLIEPLELAGVKVSRVEELTGLAEYRNGGLFIDTAVLSPRDSAAFSQTYAVSDPFVVGWRALTVAMLDRLAPHVRARLGVTEDAFSLAHMLEGGTWAAGRLIARDRRADGGAPFRIISDGTVF
ncbi:MAG: DUF1688 family protein [Steroidobacteraceae bacterium]